MIHYSCDRCHRPISAEQEIRYSLRIEVTAAIDPAQNDEEDDRDHLGELNELLNQLDDADYEEISQNAYQKRSYDLCSECYRQYCKNPLAMEVAANLGFSQN